MSTVLTIDSVDKASLIDWKSVSRKEILTKQPNHLEFLIKKYDSKTYKPVVGEEVVLTIGGVKQFGGFITEIREKITGRLEYVKIICKDYTNELDRQLVSKTYTSETVDDIVADLISTFATGFTSTNTNCPISIDKVVFNYLPISKCLEKLVGLVGNYDWYVDYDRDVHFFAPIAESSSFNLTDTSQNYIFNTLDIRENTHQLRNEIIIRGGLLTSGTAKTETLSGDGTTTIFPLATKFSTTPAISISGSSITVGVANLDSTGYQVYWDYNEKSLDFETSPADAIANVDVTQTYEFPLILQKRNEDSIATYGLFQNMIVDKNIADLETAGLRADSELIRYSDPARTARFKTYTNGLKTGQTINIQSTIRSIDQDFKIQTIYSVLKNPNQDEMTHEVECITAEDMGINDVLSRLLVTNPSDQIDIAKDEVISRIRQLQDSFIIYDQTPTALDKTSPPYKWTSGTTTLVWNFGTWG